MATLANYLGYNTYILGTTKNILGCLGIIVYNKSQLPSGVEKLSLYNIDIVYQEVIQSDKYLRIDRLDSSSPFEYNYRNGRVNGFDTIIYLSNSDNTPTGYTEFINKQGVERNIDISLAFNTTISGNLTVDLTNSLMQLRNNPTVTKNFIGEDLSQYPNVKSVQEEINKKAEIYSKPKYTTHISQFIKNQSNNIYLSYSTLIRNNTLIKLDLSKNIIVDPYELGFTNYQFGYYQGDIVVYLWKDLNYTIYSITKRNRFNNPISYINSRVGYVTIPEYETTETINQQRISYFAGKYCVVEIMGSRTTTQVFDIETQGWRNLNSSYFLIDSLDMKNRIIELPNILNYNNILNYIPEISNIYLNLEEYSKTNAITLSRKFKNWYVINNSRTGLKIYTNTSKTLYCASDEEPIIVNDQVIMTRTKNEEYGLDYYTIYYKNFKEYYTESARAITETGGKLELDVDLGIMYYKDGTNDTLYKNYYNSKEIVVVKSSDSFLDSYFSNYRRNTVPENNLSTIPDIIGAIDGIIFYKYQNTINYI